MKPNFINKMLKIHQSSAIWQCSARRAHVWIGQKNRPPYRPFVLMVVDQGSEMILNTSLLDERPSPQTVFDYLCKTMQGTLLNLLRKERPARISMDDAEMVQVCAPQLAELGIRCEVRASLPQVNTALLEIEAKENEGPIIPGLLSIRGVTVPLLAELYAAATEYQRQAPWRWIDNAVPLELHYPQNTEGFPGEGPLRYALVLGSGGETFGLSLYESLADLERLFSDTDPGAYTKDPIPSLSLIFEEATSMSFEDLDDIERYAWPMAGDKAYPLVVKAIPKEEYSQLPTASDIAWLAAALRTIPGFVSQHLGAGGGKLQPAQASFALPNVHLNQHIGLRYPVNYAYYPVSSAQDPHLEAFIADWHWDEKSHEYARQMGAFLFQFLGYLYDSYLTDQTLRKHERNCWCIGSFESRYGSHDTFTPTIFLGGPEFISEFKRKVGDSPAALNSYKTTWRKLEKYIYSQGYKDPRKKKA